MLEQLSISGFRRDPEGFYPKDQHEAVLHDRVRKTDLCAPAARAPRERGKLKAVITQNIDGLHRVAGSKEVYELHGTYKTGHCTECRASFGMDGFYSEIASGQIPFPRCPQCRVPVKPDIVLFEEILPVDAWNASVQAAQGCDLMLVFGSSLVVYPAAELPMIALESDAKLVIVNLESTSYNNLATIAIQGRLGDFSKSALATFSNPTI